MGYKCRDFECKDCGNIFDDLVKDGESTTCPECGSSNLDRLLSAPFLNTLNCLSKDEYTAKMKQRSVEHSKKLAMQNKDQHGIKKLRDV